MSASMLRTLLLKDFRLFFKNRFFAYVTLAGVLAYIGIYYLMPRQTEETLTIGVVAPGLPAAIENALAEQGLLLERYPDETALKAAVGEGELPLGVVLPPDLAPALASGSRVKVQLYLWADLPPEFQELYPIMIEEWIAGLAGQPLPVESSAEVLGIDRAGQQVAPRNRMLPLLAVMILMIETLGLASLITAEIVAGTLQALLVTPLRVEGFFLQKGILGVALAFGQTALFLAATGGLRHEPLLVLTAMLLGSAMVTGLAFLIASVSTDMMSVMSNGILVILLLGLPPLNVLLPGLASDWIKLLPSYYLAEAVHQAVNFELGWAALTSELLALGGFAAVFLAAGVVVLRRRFTWA